MASQGRSIMGRILAAAAFVVVAGAIGLSVAGGIGGSDGPEGASERVVLAPTMTLKIKDKTFKLDVAATNEARIKGMGGRKEIPPGTGMLFVFPRAQRLSFLMRDCPIAIDVIFLDASARITAIHTMQPEEPQRPGEDDSAYDARLKKYSSRFPAQYAVELAGGMAAQLGLKEGEKLALDTERLSKASDLERVKIGSKEFFLELAARDPMRMMGLSGRVEIAEDSGMLFVFPDAQERHFVMRDCPIPIDIIYLDSTGKVLAIHEMQPEPARGPTETADAYEQRLKPYPSNGPMQFAIELRGGTTRTLGLRPGATIALDVERLKRLAQ
jgi:uncharacterized membrane protein (UPF0127 family)